MGSLGATSPRRPPSHHELQSDPCKMRVFLAALLLAAARADKPAVAPAYTGAATVDETFGSALKRDAPAAAAPDSYGSPVAAPAQDTYGSPSAPVAQQHHPRQPQPSFLLGLYRKNSNEPAEKNEVWLTPGDVTRTTAGLSGGRALQYLTGGPMGKTLSFQ